MSPLPTSSVLPERIVVYVTRGTGKAEATLELLVYEDEGDLATHVPFGPVLAGEHLAEAALRCATEESGYDVFFTFRRLLSIDAAEERLHFFQTSPEVELPDEFAAQRPGGAPGAVRRFSWLREGDVARRLAPAYGAGLARLFG